MVGQTVAGFDAFLMDNYTKDEVARTMNADHYFLDMLDTTKRGGGRRLIVPLIDGNPQGLGATVATAQAGAEQAGPGANITGAAWTIAWGDYSAHVDIGDKVIDLSSNDMGAFFEDLKEEIDGLYRAFADTMSSYLLRDGGHSIGTGSFAAGVITLTNPGDAVNFERGMILVASTADGQTSTDVTLGPGALGYVISVNYNAGTVTVSATSGGAAGVPTNWTGTMFYFRNGDFGATAYAGAGSAPAFTRVILGYGAWCPPSDPTSTLFEGVDRSLNVVRRSGLRLTAAQVTGLGIEQRCKRLLTAMATYGKNPKQAVVHPTQWQALGDSLETKGVRNISSSEKVGSFSFETLQMFGPGGVVKVFAEKFMPQTSLYMFDPSGLGFKSASGFPKVVNGDGLTMLRKATENTYEFRLATYAAYFHKDPTKTGRCPLLVPS